MNIKKTIKQKNNLTFFIYITIFAILFLTTIIFFGLFFPIIFITLGKDKAFFSISDGLVLKGKLIVPFNLPFI